MRRAHPCAEEDQAAWDSVLDLPGLRNIAEGEERLVPPLTGTLEGDDKVEWSEVRERGWGEAKGKVR